MTRSQKKMDKSPDNAFKVDSKKRVENSWILLAKDSLLQNDQLNIITLPHPAHSKPAKYCIDETQKKIYEVVTFNEPHRCWFTGQAIKSDASLLMLTPVNPLFIVLPHIRTQCHNRAIPFEDLMANKCFGKVFSFLTDLNNVADLKGTQDLKAYKYNESKTLTWLESKILKLSRALKVKNIHVTSGAVSATFVASNVNSDNIDEDFFLKYALGIMAEYIEDDIVKKLELKFNFKPDLIQSLGQKRKSEVNEGNNKRIKCEQNDIKNNTSESAPMLVSNATNKLKPLSAKEKARQKAASGTKTISTFFTKK